MATHDYVIANQSGASFRTDLNNALAAIVSNNSNSSEPATKYAYQWWADTSNNKLKIRNSANNGWIELFQLDGTLTLEDGSASTPALAFRDDLDTGIFSGGANEFNISTGGTERFVIDSSGRCGIGALSPSVTLDIEAALPVIRLTDSDASGTPECQISGGGGDLVLIADRDDEKASTVMQFQTDGSTAMTIDSDQDVGIGVTSPSVRCDIADTDTTAWSTSNLSTALRVQNLGATNSIAAGIQLRMENGNGAAAIQYIHCVGSSTNHSSDLVFTRRRATTGAYEEQMRIKNHGELKLTQASSVATTPAMHLDRPNAAANAAVDMIHFDSGNQGRGKLVSASSDAGSPALASRSDYRIKENIRDYTTGWDIIKAVPVKLFDVKTDGSKDQKGWIAHELQAVLPDLVQGTKDAVDEDGNPIYQSVSMGLFMPDVISALQAAITKIETLETKVAALEAA